MPIPEQILPQVIGENFRHRLGAFPVEITNWLPRDAETDLTIALKKKLLATRRDEVVALRPGGEDVAQEAAQLVSQWAGVKLTSTGINALVEASLLIADDLAVLQPVKSQDGAEQLLLNAAVVCCPSRWMLSEKMGHNMLEVHAPVATLRRLPKTGGILFTIRGYQQPLPEYLARSKHIAQNLRTMLERLPDDVAQYKSVLKYRPNILNWINQFC